jgi:hypothetical protein
VGDDNVPADATVCSEIARSDAPMTRLAGDATRGTILGWVRRQNLQWSMNDVVDRCVDKRRVVRRVRSIDGSPMIRPLFDSAHHEVRMPNEFSKRTDPPGSTRPQVVPDHHRRREPPAVLGCRRSQRLRLRVGSGVGRRGGQNITDILRSTRLG